MTEDLLTKDIDHLLAANLGQVAGGSLGERPEVSDSDAVQSWYAPIAAAHENGNTVGVVHGIRSAIGAAEAADKAGDTTERTDTLRRRLIGHGFADELVEARVRMVDSGAIPSAGESKKERTMLALATGVTYDETYRSGGPLPWRAVESAKLDAKDWVALAGATQDRARGETFLRRSFDTLEAIGYNQKPPDIVDYIRSAHEYVPASLPDVLDGLRQSREVTGATVVLATRTSDAMVKLIQQREIEAASRLVTASTREALSIENALLRAKVDLGEHKEIVDMILAMSRQKAQAVREDLTARMQAVGMDEKAVDSFVTDTLIHNNDPESALAIPDAFWQMQPPSRLLRELSQLKTPLGASAECAFYLSRHGIDPARDVSITTIKRMGSFYPPEGREAYAASLAQALGQVDRPEWAAYNLAEFADPVAALEVARRLFGTKGDKDALDALHTALDGEKFTGQPVALDPTYVGFLEQLRSELSSLGADKPHILETFGRSIAQSEDPEKLCFDILRTLPTLGGFGFSSEDIRLIAHSTDPVGAADMATTFANRFISLHPSLKNSLLSTPPDQTTYRERARSLFAALDTLASHGIVPNDDNYQEIRDMFKNMQKAESESAAQEQLTKLVDHHLILRQIQGILAEDMVRIRAEAAGKPVPKAPLPPPFERFSAIKSILDRLGVPDDLGRQMIDKWDDFQSLGTLADKQKKPVHELTDEMVQIAARNKAYVMEEQLSAVRTYIDQYGLKELLSVHRQFRIRMFGRYEAADLHDQLERWNDPKEAPVTILVTGYADHNGAMLDQGKGYAKMFGKQGRFFFEVASKRELIELKTSIGIRERRFGRDPQKNPTIKNVVLSGHADASQFDLDYFDIIEVKAYLDYIKAGRRRDQKHASRNLYSRDLGDQYTLTLDSCGAGPRLHGKRLGQLIHEHLGVNVQERQEEVSGITLDADGNIAYLTGKGTVAPVLHSQPGNPNK